MTLYVHEAHSNGLGVRDHNCFHDRIELHFRVQSHAHLPRIHNKLKVIPGVSTMGNLYYDNPVLVFFSLSLEAVVRIK